MKIMKYLLVIVALLAASIMQAQVRFGAKGGVSIIDVHFNRSAFKSDNVTGFHVGPTLEAMFGQGGVGFDVALLYIQKGFDSDEERVKNSYLELPANLKFKFGTPVVNPFVAVGPYFNFCIAGDMAWDVLENTGGVKDQVKAKKIGAGLNFGAGAEFFDKLQLSLNYSRGLTDNYETIETWYIGRYTGKAHAWSVSAVFFF